MILLQSAKDDKSTMDVLGWIAYLGNSNFIRLNNEVSVNSIEIDDDIKILTSECELKYSLVDMYWYRRGVFLHQFSNAQEKQNLSFLAEINKVFSKLEIIHKKNIIGKYKDNDLNKLEMLFRAFQAGLKVPKTIVTGSRDSLIQFIKSSNGKIVTKALHNNSFKIETKSNYRCYLNIKTKLIKIEDCLNGNMKDGIPALFQEYVDKQYEIRIFYFKGQLYNMAIFSQQSEKTKIDFRNYDREKPNRNVPYQLPKDIEEKLDKFMKAIDMNCGSIDMIYTPKGEYVFLEVNPVGQYQWLEKNCNYPISKKIAEALINE